ncbi:MAG: magnesium transporter CorA family protein [Acidimicrobiia bacterium]
MKALVRRKGEDRFRRVEELGDVEDYDMVWVDLGEEDAADAGSVLAHLGLMHHGEHSTSGTSINAAVSETESSISVLVPTFAIEVRAGMTATTYRAVLGTRALVTIHSSPIPAIEYQLESLATGPAGTINSAELASIVASAVSRQVLPLIDDLEIRIDGLEELAFASDPNTLIQVQALRRDLITLRRVVSRQRDLMDDLSVLVHDAVGERGQTAFRRVFDHDARLVESIDSARSLLQSVLETYRGAVADQTNEIVRVLTVFSAILLPLALISGLWGMNFDLIPGDSEQWGFWTMIGGMALFAVGLWVYFSKRGFVGAPRLRELPKAVGLGLIQLSTAPVKAIATGVGTGIQHLDRRKQDPPEG